jgi:hypothetical protein
MQTELEFHPLANMFPLITGREFDALVSDIKARGLVDPIILCDGKILDGRNRYRACQQLRLTPRQETLNSGSDPLGFVISKNLHRRHLKESQRAMIAARLATLKTGQRADRMRQSADTSIAQLTGSEAAKLLNVSLSSISRARLILEKGTAAEIKAVDHGAVALIALVQQIKVRQPKSFRAKLRAGAKSTKCIEHRQRQRLRGDMWTRLRTALSSLAEMPRASDIVELMARTARVPPIIDAKLMKASQWLKEFEHEWSNRG